MDYLSLIVSIISAFLSLISIIVAICACIIANKPYLKRLSIVETYPEKESSLAIAITNIGREVIYIDRVEFLNFKTRKVLGRYYFDQDNDYICVLKPGTTQYLEIPLSQRSPHYNDLDPNRSYEIIIHEKNGHRTTHRGFFAVG